MKHVVDAQQGEPKNDFDPLSEEGRGVDLWHLYASMRLGV